MAQLGRTVESARDMIAYLHDNLWIDQYTRLVMAEAVVYDANDNLFATVEGMFEFPSFGGLIKRYEIRPMKLYRYANELHLFVLACEILYLIYLLYFIVKQIKLMVKLKCKYFKDFWNIMELFIIIISLTAIVIYIFRSVETGRVLAEYKAEREKYHSFYQAAVFDMTLGYLLGVIVMLGTIKFIHILRLNPKVFILTETLKRAASELRAQFIVILLVFTLYACVGTTLFGSAISVFRSFLQSFLTMFAQMMGGFDEKLLTTTEKAFGPIFLLSFSLLMHLFFLNLLISVILGMQTLVRKEHLRSEEDELVDLMFARITAWLGIKYLAESFKKRSSHNDAVVKDQG